MRRKRVWEKRLSSTPYPFREKPFFRQILPENHFTSDRGGAARELFKAVQSIDRDYLKQGKTV